MGVLLNHYEGYQAGKLSYEEFYNKYGREIKTADFSRKPHLEINIEPDIVNIIESAPKSLQGGNSKPNLLNSTRHLQTQREL